MLVEVKPRSGVFAASRESVEPTAGLAWAQTVYRLLDDTAQRGQRLGLSPARLARLLATLEPGTDASVVIDLPILATQDAFECMVACLPEDFPANLVHLPPSTRPGSLTDRPRYILCGYYRRDRARLVAETTGSGVLHVRYNVELLDAFMTIGSGERRQLVTRDADNAETTRGMLASAYPEIPSQLYTVSPLGEWLTQNYRQDRSEVWATVTAAKAVAQRTPDHRVKVMHPVLAEDFVDELRCLALFLQSEAARG